MKRTSAMLKETGRPCKIQAGYKPHFIPEQPNAFPLSGSCRPQGRLMRCAGKCRILRILPANSQHFPPHPALRATFPSRGRHSPAPEENEVYRQPEKQMRLHLLFHLPSFRDRYDRDTAIRKTAVFTADRRSGEEPCASTGRSCGPRRGRGTWSSAAGSRRALYPPRP